MYDFEKPEIANNRCADFQSWSPPDTFFHMQENKAISDVFIFRYDDDLDNSRSLSDLLWENIRRHMQEEDTIADALF